MCQRCADSSGDKRTAAFQPIFTVTWISQAQAKQTQHNVETQSGGPINLETATLLSEDEARGVADALEGDPNVFRFTVERSAICLN